MSTKSSKVRALIQKHRGRNLDAHYLGYLDCFNRGAFYEAHDVLEELWLAGRGGPNASFYKGMIQLAGAFVHLQKDRLRPAAALLRLARASLQGYPPVQERLEVTEVLAIIDDWVGRLESGRFTVNPLADGRLPKLKLLP